MADEQDGLLHIRLEPGERLDRDFILRFRLASRDPEKNVGSSLTLHPDAIGKEQRPGGYVRPDADSASRCCLWHPPRDVVFVLDRSGSMGGWKIVAARRAMARMIDTLGESDRYAVLAFDDHVETPPGLTSGLVPATDRNRFRALEYLARIHARGGTEMAEPLAQAVDRLTGTGMSAPGAESAETPRDRILVLVTDGQVGNEDQILRSLDKKLRGVRVSRWESTAP